MIMFYLGLVKEVDSRNEFYKDKADHKQVNMSEIELQDMDVSANYNMKTAVKLDDDWTAKTILMRNWYLFIEKDNKKLDKEYVKAWSVERMNYTFFSYSL